MAETTGIAWTDATANFWEGCQSAGRGCNNCYAEARDQRFHGGSHFGPGAERRRVVPATFNRPRAWDSARRAYEAGLRRAEGWPRNKPVPPQWVFSLSLGDFFDNAVPPEWRADAWTVIRECSALRWQIVTKRVGNVLGMLPADWNGGIGYGHVGIIATVCDQREYDRDAHKLAALKAGGVRWVGLSVEPMLGPVRITPADDPGLDWVIIGGESSQGGKAARPFHLAWCDWLMHDCIQAQIPVFVKQLGSHPIQVIPRLKERSRLVLRDSVGASPAEWPEHLRVQEMPAIYDGGLIVNRLAARP